jgi:hypothetical protein
MRLALRAKAGDRRSERVKDQVSNGTLKGGNNTAYTLARLDRDRPDLALGAEIYVNRGE